MILLVAVFGLLANGDAYAAKKKSSKKKSIQSSVKKKSVHSKKKKSITHYQKSKNKKKGNYSARYKKPSKKMGVKLVAKHDLKKGNGSLPTEKTVSAPLQLIAQNKEKVRVTDSMHKSLLVNAAKIEDEGYFASLFTHQKKSASFQTLEGTAAVFKSLSGWNDKKFYILTNQLPVGTVVRITTSDFKSVCAKVINSLPEVGNAVQYRLNDAAAAILGITNKTFQISVTY